MTARSSRRGSTPPAARPRWAAGAGSPPDSPLQAAAAQQPVMHCTLPWRRPLARTLPPSLRACESLLPLPPIHRPRPRCSRGPPRPPSARSRWWPASSTSTWRRTRWVLRQPRLIGWCGAEPAPPAQPDERAFERCCCLLRGRVVGCPIRVLMGDAVLTKLSKPPTLAPLRQADLLKADQLQQADAEQPAAAQPAP